jgi:hypothetical protein
MDDLHGPVRRRGRLGRSLGIPMTMNSGQDASPDLPDADGPDDDTDAATDPLSDIDPGIDTESLQRSRDAIDQGREAAREVLKDDTNPAGDADS